METITIGFDFSWRSVAANAVRAANRKGERIMARMHDGGVGYTYIKCDPCEDIEAGASVFLKRVQRYLDLEKKRWSKSPAGKKCAAEQEEKRVRKQQELDEAMAELPKLDFTNLVAVLRWIAKTRDPMDLRRVKRPFERIVEIFREHGYKADGSLTRCDEDDVAGCARLLVEDTLSEYAKGDSVSGCVVRLAKELIQKLEAVS